MIGRYRGGEIPQPGAAGDPELALRAVAEESARRGAAEIERWDLDGALDAIWLLVRRANQYLEERQPWKLAKQPEQADTLGTTLWTAAEATRLIAIYLSPFIPATSDKIMAQLGLDPITPGSWTRDGIWGSVALTQVHPAGTLFPRIETT